MSNIIEFPPVKKDRDFKQAVQKMAYPDYGAYTRNKFEIMQDTSIQKLLIRPHDYYAHRPVMVYKDDEPSFAIKILRILGIK